MLIYAGDMGLKHELNSTNSDQLNLVSTPAEILIDRPSSINLETPEDILIDRPL